MNLFTEEQQQRYESFRRSSLKEPMKKLIQVVSGSKPDSQSKIMIALCSVSKTFVGELVEESKRVAEEDGHTGPLQPTHVMEGYQRLMAAGLVESIEQNGRPKLKL
jgi:transcription initiation factor TFIID subunit 11